MPHIQYLQPTERKDSTQEIIVRANAIIEEYTSQGYRLTLRQLYYQFVARGYLLNKQTEYNRLGSIINDARLTGDIDWDSLTDLTREMTENAHWSSPRGIVAACRDQYQIDKWATQPNYVEVWIEKDALAGVIEPVCRSLDVPFFACRGYTSQSAMWEAGQRLKKRADDGKQCVVLHLGDHDPSGIDMTRDITARLTMFMSDPDDMDRADLRDVTEYGYPEDDRLEVRRIALNMDQVKRFNPPPNPAKITDSRADDYIRRFGASSWELDALDPKTLTALITANVAALLDAKLWAVAKKRETEHRLAIARVVDQLPSGDDDDDES